MRPPPNNIDLLRFVLAAIVVLFHVGVLSGSQPLRAAFYWADGQRAVLGFFAISGYAVSLSWMRLDAREYFQHRARRLLPGYFAVVLGCWLAGAAPSSLPAAQYWRSTETWRYLAANLTCTQFLGPSLPGVFSGNPLTNAVNGSLWSIRAELFCYLILPFIAGVRWRAAALIALCVGASIWEPSFLDRELWATLGRGVFHPVTSFALGALVAQAKRLHVGLLGIAGALVLSFEFSSRWVLEPLAVAAVVLALAVAIPALGRWAALGNLSYGMYLWHFPVIQALCTRIKSPWMFFSAVVVATLGVAMLSWNGIEKWFLIRAARRTA
jgi:peptidoglycan/LPS O-acetylase OafA/YrhL